MRAAPLTGARLEALPDDCRSCLFWERGGAVGGGGADDRVRKEAWVTDRELSDGAPGRVVVRADRVVGHAVFGPPGAFRPRPPLEGPAATDDALLLATVWVDPTQRNTGVGRLLVQAAVKEAHHRDLEAVQAWGDRSFRESRCVLPLTWLLHQGFVVATEHPRRPLLRLEVSRTARWADALGHAVDEVRDLLPRRVAPRPVPERILTDPDAT